MTRLDDAFFSALPTLDAQRSQSGRSHGSQSGRSERQTKMSKRGSSGISESSGQSPRRQPSLVATEL